MMPMWSCACLAAFCLTTASCSWSARSRQSSGLKPLSIEIADPPKLVPNELRASAKQKDGTVWLLVRGAVVRYRPASGQTRIFTYNDGLPQIHVEDVMVDSQDRVWTDGSTGPSLYDNRSESWRKIALPEEFRSSCRFSGQLTEMADGSILFANEYSEKSGLARYVPGSDRFELYTSSSIDQRAIQFALSTKKQVVVIANGIFRRREEDADFTSMSTQGLPASFLPESMWAVGESIFVRDRFVGRSRASKPPFVFRFD
jgi:hypothetical protein